MGDGRIFPIFLFPEGGWKGRSEKTPHPTSFLGHLLPKGEGRTVPIFLLPGGEKEGCLEFSISPWEMEGYFQFSFSPWGMEGLVAKDPSSDLVPRPPSPQGRR
jgi:hypothetical protein